MAEATTSPIFDRRRPAPETREPIVVGDVVIPRSGDTELVLDGRALKLTNLDRVLYPETGFTKAESIAYHVALAPLLLAHLRDRALTVGRFPGGVDGRGFAQSEVPGRPPWLRTTTFMLAKGEAKQFIIAEERAALAWLAQMGTIELHTFPGRASDLERPTAVMFDLDPAAPAGLLDAAGVALALRERLAGRGLAAFAKTSGSAGMHVVVPLNGAATHAETKAFAQQIAKELAGAEPDRVSDRMERAGRAGKVLVDARQNSMRLTMALPYSLRSTPRPFVSTPVAWDEIASAVRAHEQAEARDESADAPAPLRFEAGDVVLRAGEHGDLFAAVLTLEQSLTAG